ncbi:hypothetical protein BC938DRAFT_481856 [Jimgerdemannia flammicorona]|uniref:Ubiquitin-like protease family profile domain-containing protein n=1 Tax=Jimgerdemannia flammicorona TaxID=994334 RepID=A0A433QFC4_9FUNG|nr:hypothetical protein BC938DRAFT_481856 [Jimgerdemannia flammicorona]
MHSLLDTTPPDDPSKRSVSSDCKVSRGVSIFTFLTTLTYRPFIAILDSMSDSTGQDVLLQAANPIQEYLTTMATFQPGSASVPKIRDTDVVIAKVPQQTNGFDCGIYLLYFAQLFLFRPDHFCKILLENTDASEWESKTPIPQMRTRVYYVIQFLSKQPTGPTHCAIDDGPHPIQDKGKKKLKEKAIPSTHKELRPRPAQKRPAVENADTNPCKRKKMEKRQGVMPDKHGDSMVTEFWDMIKHAQHLAKTYQISDDPPAQHLAKTCQISDDPPAQSSRSNTLVTLVQKALQSDESVRVANNANIISYLKLGKKINALALAMYGTRSFQTKAKTLVNQIMEIPGVKDRGAAGNILTRAKWVYSLFRNIPSNIIAQMEGFTVKNATHWPLPVRTEIATGNRMFDGSDPFPCWLEEY